MSIHDVNRSKSSLVTMVTPCHIIAIHALIYIDIYLLLSFCSCYFYYAIICTHLCLPPNFAKSDV